MRINKFIAENTEISRRKADELIELGKVKLNGQTLKNLGEQINPEQDKVEVNGRKITVKNKKIYIALNKPQGYVTTRSDELGRQTVLELIPPKQNLKPVGRLDKNTEGLLLISNDGTFIHKLTHPKFQCEKEYIVRAEGNIPPQSIKKLQKGINIDHKKTSPSKIHSIKRENDTTSLHIIIHEGRNRQIRKMFAQIGYPVKYLQRIRIGNLQLKNLAKGKFRHLTQEEVNDY